MKRIFQIATLLLVSSCTEKKSIQTQVMNLDRVIEPNERLLQEGFQKTQVDVLMFEKKNGDTTLYLEYDYDRDEIESKYWEFPILKKDHHNQIETFFEKRNCYLRIKSQCNSNNDYQSLCFQNNLSKEVFFVQMETLDSLHNVVRIRYDYLKNQICLR